MNDMETGKLIERLGVDSTTVHIEEINV